MTEFRDGEAIPDEPQETPYKASVPPETEEGRKDRYNEIIRASANAGYSLLHEMEEDLIAAWLTHDAADPEKRVQIRGRIRGIAMCIALVRSPYSRLEMGPRSRRWLAVIQQQEDEGHARARSRRDVNA